MAWSFTLPIPPSVNQIWFPIGSRFATSEKYKAWQTHANQMMLTQQRPKEPLAGRLTIHITLPYSARADADNLAKAPIDLMQSAGVIRNDRQVDRLLVYRAAHVDDQHCQIEIAEKR